MNKLLSKNDHIIKKQSWCQDGQLEKTSNEFTASHHEYDQEGILKRVLITPPTDDTQFSQWMSKEVDDQGWPTEISAYSGFKIKAEYDPSGNPVAITANSNIINFNHNEKNRITAIDMPAINKKINCKYSDSTGVLEQVSVSRGNSNASILFDKGMPAKSIQFDGGTYDISYESQESGNDRVKRVKTPDDSNLEYKYDTKGRLSSIHYDGTYELRYSYDDHGRINSHAMVFINEKRHISSPF